MPEIGLYNNNNHVHAHNVPPQL